MWVAVATAAISTIGAVAQRRSAKKAAKQAREDQLEDASQARRAEVFAETEGEGLGQLGQVSLEVDEDVEDENISSNIRI